MRKFGDDTAEPYPLVAVEAPVIGQRLGVQQLVSAGESDTGLVFAEKPVIIGTIRMGFGHYRIGMAMASAAHALGCTPYWMNLMGYPDTSCSKIISAQNDLYSLGSRISQKSKLFNAVV
ncbi:MAG: hypothetical protein IKF96_02355, partial [Eggerthellaceae bacterium]|nr:hypothetical protein [Eggerthellaceae bacterium]